MKSKNLPKVYMEVQGESVSILKAGNEDYISLTDIAKYENTDDAFVEPMPYLELPS